MPIKEYTYEETRSTQVAEPMGIYHTEQNRGVHLYSPTLLELEAIKRGEEQIARGEYYTQEEMDQMMKEWLS